MEPVLGTIGIFCIALTMAVFVATWQHNANSPHTWSWEATGVAVAVLGIVGGGLVTVALVNGGTIEAGGKENVKIEKVAVPGPTVTVTAPPPAPVPISFTSPGDGADFTICGIAKGKATLADGQVVVVGEEEPDENRWYFESETAYNADRTGWSTHIQLGDETDLKTKGTFNLIAMVMTQKDAAYLTSTQETQDPDTGKPLTYWSSQDLPPAGVLGTQQITVNRVPSGKDCAS